MDDSFLTSRARLHVRARARNRNRNRYCFARRSAYSLSELLIAGAIVLVLMVAAVPGSRRARTRSAVSRAKAEMFRVGIALEAYQTDNEYYPFYPISFYPSPVDRMTGYTPVRLTTPVPYLDRLPQDPFAKAKGFPRSPSPGIPNPFLLFDYETQRQYTEIMMEPYWSTNGPHYVEWLLFSPGPDNAIFIHEGTKLHGNVLEYLWDWPWPGQSLWYDPTNGATSWGDLVLWGPHGGFDPPATAFQPLPDL